MHGSLQVFHSPQYHVDLGAHVFPTAKYHLVRDRLLQGGRAGVSFGRPEPIGWDDLALVHTPTYLTKVARGSLSVIEIARLEMPWSLEIVEGFRAMTGGTVAAARAALRTGASVNLGGGFHHAFPDHGEGFCLFNDVAVAIRRLQRDGELARAAVVDCDVHQGNGTAAIFSGDARVFTFSIHQENNYPMVKPASSLDIGLPDGTLDQEYLRRLEQVLPRIMATKPDALFYLAGADPYEDDQLGGLALTVEGLRRRDVLVLGAVREAGVPIVVVLAGGYARKLGDTVAIHVATVREVQAWSAEC